MFYDSTQPLPAPQKHQFWNDAVCKRLIPAVAEFEDRASFEGSLTGHKVGSLTICEMASSPHTFVRTAQRARTEPEEDIVGAFVKDGYFYQEQEGRSVMAERGDIILFDSAKPFLHKMNPASVFILRFPREQILSRFAKAENMFGIKIAEGTTLAPLLYGLVADAFKLKEMNVSPAAQARLASAIMDTLTAAMQIQFESSGKEDAGRYGTIYRKAMQYIEANLDNFALDANDIAEAVHVSTRTIARVFATQEQTVMQQVWKLRLQLGHRILSEGRVEQVSQAAFQCGFNDLSHFSRSFKLQFGTSPRDVFSKSIPAAEQHH